MLKMCICSPQERETVKTTGGSTLSSQTFSELPELTCLDNVTDSDGSLRALREKIASFIATNSSRNWARDLYEKIARSL
uniref:Uncharacterized protein n=1 Tax=Cannabis sativa TaxID=3483 RepID=A0A803P741_CANSA